MSGSTSSFTPLSLLTLPSKKALTDEFVGKPLSSLRTPAIIIDRTRFKDNCEKVTSQTEKRGMKFRAHVKSRLSWRVRAATAHTEVAHKTFEGTRMQVEASQGVKAVICSTMVEVWQVVQSGLIEEGLVDDVSDI